MKNVTTKAAAKVAAVATGLAMATSMLSFAPMVHAAALTPTQVQSVLGLLTAFGASSATIANVNASLTGTAVTSGSTTTSTGTSAACSFSANLTIGSSGMAVTCLQNALIAGGFSIPAGATGYFGTQTRTAVASWQSSRNIAPAVGYFGALSRAAWNLGGTTTSSTTTTTTTTTSTVAGCVAGAAFSATTGAACTVASTVAGCAAGAVFSATTGQACSGTTTTTTTTALTGSGRLTNVASANDTTSDLKEGDAATQVIGVSADATGGDVAIQRVDVQFDIAAGGSASLDRYVSDVSLYLDGKLLQHMDPALGDKTSRQWILRFSGLNGVIKSGTTGNLYVKVTPLSTIATAEAGKVVTVTLGTDSVRAVGADGISDTYVTSFAETFNVTAATTGALTVSVGNDNPAAGIVAVASSTTSGVNLLSFNLKAKNSAVTVTDLVANLSTTLANVTDVVSSVKLMKGSTVIKTGSTVFGTTSATTTFSGIDQTIAKDATTGYWISVDLKSDAYPDGTTIAASTTIAGLGWDVSDANGNTVTITTNAVGNAHTLTATGILVVKGVATAVTTTGLSSNGDVTQYAIPFTVTAGDADVFIGGFVTRLASAVTVPSVSAGGVNYATTTSSTASSTNMGTTNFTAANVVVGDTGAGATLAYKVLANTSRTFTLNVAYTATGVAGATGYTGVILTGINYGPTATLGTTYYTSGLDTYKTANVLMQMH